MDDSSSAPPVQPTPAAPPSAGVLDERGARMWAMWCHLSALAGYIVPLGNILGPVLVWQMKKDEFPIVNEHGREAVNFQISLLLYLLGGGIAAFIGSFFCLGILLIPALGALALAGMVFSIIAGVKANDGVFYKYPMNLRLIK
jgi:uncharacterized protein